MANEYYCDECKAPFTATNRCVCDELIEVDAGLLAILERVAEAARKTQADTSELKAALAVLDEYR